MKIANRLLKGWEISASDAARIVMECLEKLGIEGRGRREKLEQLRRVVGEGVRVVKERERTECFETVAWASVAARASRRATTRRDLRGFIRRMLRVEGVANKPLRGMRAADCRAILDSAFGASASSYKKGRTILHSIFAYGMRQEWCDANPVDRIEAPRVVERRIAPLTLEEVRRLEATARLPEHAAMRFSLYMMLYCGLRPYEVQRLQPEDVRYDEREVIIRPAVSKTGGGRVVPLRGRVQQWSMPSNWGQRWRALRRAAGFKEWQADVCRHSFASYHAAYYRDMVALQYEMGHRSQQLLRTRYVTPVARRCAELFWRERPEVGAFLPEVACLPA